MTPSELVEGFKTVRKEVANREVTIRAMQRNYESLSAAHERCGAPPLRGF
jgi:hypothetical protein